jgi:hypothetical protein
MKLLARSRRVLLLAFVAAAVSYVGCGPTPTSQPSSGDAGNADVTLKVIKFDQLTAVLAAQKGQIVVMDVWSTT